MERYGEYRCPECGKYFFNYKSLHCHIGANHRKNEGLICKFCSTKLVKGKNWTITSIKKQLKICRKCLNRIRRERYHQGPKRKRLNRKRQLADLKDRLRRKRQRMIQNHECTN